MKQIVFLSLLIVGSSAHAAKLTIQTTSPELICVYVDDVNELCVKKDVKKKKDIKKSIELTPQAGHRILAVDHTGNISSDFLTIKIPQNVTEAVLEVATQEVVDAATKKTTHSMVVTSPTAGVSLGKEK